MKQIFLLMGSGFMFLAVTIGAFGAHGLKNKLDAYAMSVYNTAVEYHFYHALGLLLLGILMQQYKPSLLLNISGWSMGLGILIFSGSLYALAISGVKWLGAITPIGGLCFLIAWFCFFAGVIKAS